MTKRAIGGEKAHQRWGKDADPSIVDGLPWSTLDIYEIAAGSLESASRKINAADAGGRSPHEHAHAYDHICRLAYRGTQDFIETTLHQDLADSAGEPSEDGYPQSSDNGPGMGAIQYADPDANQPAPQEEQTTTFADLIGEKWQACVAPNSLYANDSPAAYTAALFGEITNIASAQQRLAGRRPDIAAALISRDSIKHESRELERVITILKGQNDDSVKAKLATSYFPWNLPFIESFATIKAALNCQGTNPGDLVFEVRKALQPNGGGVQDQQLDQLWLAYLGIAKAERDILTGPAWTADTVLTDYFGHLVSPAAAEQTRPTLNLDNLCDALQLDESDKTVLLDAMGLEQHGQTPCPWLRGDVDALSLDAGDISCSIAFLDRLHRFSRLYRWLKLDLADLIALLNIVAADAAVTGTTGLTQEQMLDVGLFCMLRSRYRVQVKDFGALVQLNHVDEYTKSVSAEQQPSLAVRARLQAESAVSGTDLDAALQLISNRGITLTPAALPCTVARLKLLSRIAQVPLEELGYLLTTLAAFAESPDDVRPPSAVSPTDGTPPSGAKNRINRSLSRDGQSSLDFRNFIFSFCALAEWRAENKINSVKLNDIVVLNANLLAGDIDLGFIQAIANLAQGRVSELDPLMHLASGLSNRYGIAFESARDSLRQLSVPTASMLAKCASDVLSRLQLPIDAKSSQANINKFRDAIHTGASNIRTDCNYISAILIQDAFIAPCLSMNSTVIKNIAAHASTYGLSPVEPGSSDVVVKALPAERALLHADRLNFNVLGSISMLRNVMATYDLSRDDLDRIEKVIKKKKKIVINFIEFKTWAEQLQNPLQTGAPRTSDLQWAHCYARLQKLSAQYSLPVDLLASVVASVPDYSEPRADDICQALHAVFGESA